MIQEFTITVYSENHIGLLNQISIIFTRRHLNIESLTVSASAQKSIHKFTIVINSNQEQVEKVIGQIEKRIDVIKAFYHTNDEIIYQEVALYKVPTKSLLDGNEIEMLVRKNDARILEVTEKYTVIEKTGHYQETQELFEKLDKYDVYQFTRSGRIAITKLNKELLNNYLRELETENEQLK